MVYAAIEWREKEMADEERVIYLLPRLITTRKVKFLFSINTPFLIK